MSADTYIFPHNYLEQVANNVGNRCENKGFKVLYSLDGFRWVESDSFEWKGENLVFTTPQGENMVLENALKRSVSLVTFWVQNRLNNALNSKVKIKIKSK